MGALETGASFSSSARSVMFFLFTIRFILPRPARRLHRRTSVYGRISVRPRCRIPSLMAVGIIIHISVGPEKRTEFFSEDRLSIGAADSCDLQIQTSEIAAPGVWFELENGDGVYRATK